MSSATGELAQRIRDELVVLERVAARVCEAWTRSRRAGDDYYLDSVALNLHGFYSGLERLFELIAVVVDGARPSGENWHQALLLQMASEVASVRPAVISASVRQELDIYRGFRHVVRNVYAYNFDPARVQTLVDVLPHLVQDVSAELTAFADFLEQRRERDEFSRP